MTNFIDQTVSVLLGNGDGTFSGPTTYPVGDGPDDVASGDFNGDGNLDLVVANSGGGSETASILLGRGDGTFRRPTDVEVGPNPNAVAVGDFNGDLVPDLAFSLAFFSSGGISILLGNGDGTLQRARARPRSASRRPRWRSRTSTPTRCSTSRRPTRTAAPFSCSRARATARSPPR